MLRYGQSFFQKMSIRIWCFLITWRLCARRQWSRDGMGRKDFNPPLQNSLRRSCWQWMQALLRKTARRCPLKKAETLTLPLTKALKNQIMIIRFDVESKRGKEVIIEINGMRNNLSAESAPYPNENHTFTYVLSANEVMDKLEIEFSKGIMISAGFKSIPWTATICSEMI